MNVETFADLLGKPPRLSFLVEGVIPEKSLGMIYGESGVGKTFVALDALHSLATGMAWLGHAARKEGGSGLYVAAEGVPGFPGRAVAWHIARGKPSLDRMRYLREPLRIHDPGACDTLCAMLAAQQFSPDIIVIDTASANGPPGFDDNKAEHWKAIFDATSELMRRLNCAAYFIHHPGHAGHRLRGSYDQIARADVIMRIERTGRLAARLTLEKHRDFSWDGWVDYSLQKVDCSNPGEEPAISLVPALRESEDGAVTPAQLTALKALARAAKPLKAKEWQTATGLKERTFYTARLHLVTDARYVGTQGSTYIITDAGRAAILAADLPNCNGSADDCNGSNGHTRATTATTSRLFRDGSSAVAPMAARKNGHRPVQPPLPQQRGSAQDDVL